MSEHVVIYCKTRVSGAGNDTGGLTRKKIDVSGITSADHCWTAQFNYSTATRPKDFLSDAML
ncbi:hypothetical protein CPAR01_07170 [Colletotrichum paranaense]|uniref:Uncharacterized protein n=1 Tax=Colletotrichum paranaense TaxID=1914294 RepID=A0ABQ9SNU3_9PEZI|nr:uncharacterized protein CPAR01_07170 [Colletotrichum paranaense]KAK1541181.1 hypothetical protein CPAR01_07170 [Colletotrichum paranaense]